MELLQIEKELAGPRKSEVLAHYDGLLVALTARVRSALAQGLAPAEFERCRDLVDAVTVARKLLRLQTRPPEGSDAVRPDGIFVRSGDRTSQTNSK